MPTYPRLRSVYLAVALLAVLAAVYSTLFFGSAEFIGDDSYYIDVVKKLTFSDFPGIWKTPTKFEYFPVTISAFFLQHMLWGESHKLFHLVNLLVFFFIGLAAVSVAIELNRDKAGRLRETAFFFAAIALLHPSNVESVASISSIKELLYVLLGILSLRFFIMRTTAGTALGLAFAALSQLSKGTAVVLPMIFLAYELLYRDDRHIKKAFLRTAPYFVLAGIIFFIQFRVASQSNIISSTGLDFSSRVGGFMTTLSMAAWKTILPLDLSFDYDINWPGSFNFIEWFLPALLFSLFVYLLLAKKHKALFLCLLAVIPFAPYSNIIPLKHIVPGKLVYYDHYMLFILAASIPLLTRAALSFPAGLNRALIIASLALGVAYAAADYRLAGFWKTKEAMYSRIIEQSPGLSRSYYFLGEDYLVKEQYAMALELFQKASNLGQRPPDNYYFWLGNAYAFSGDYERAVPAYKEHLKNNPAEKEAAQNLSSALIMLKRYGEAKTELNKIILTDPGDSSTLYNLKLIEDAQNQGAGK